MSLALNPPMAMPELDARQVTEDYHRWAYSSAMLGRSWGAVKYHGMPIWKFPTDLWLYVEVINEAKPALIIETGTHEGGSALFFAHQLDQLSHGKVITIDIQPMKAQRPRHPRIEYITKKSSVDPEVALVVKRAAREADGAVMVVLDSDHAKQHVLKELALYAPLVTAGSYLVVEDTNVNGHPVYPEHGPGPQEALEAWPGIVNFKEDTVKEEKFGFSFHRWFQARRG